MNENESVMSENQIYEISFIFDNKLEESGAISKLDSLKELIASNNGSFISEEAPYKRELAYEMIRVQNNVNIRFNDGYFGWVKFEMSAESISVLDKKLKLDEQVVRYLIVKAERGNDVFTKDKEVVRSDNTAPVIIPQEELVSSEEVNIDTTTEDANLEKVEDEKEVKE